MVFKKLYALGLLGNIIVAVFLTAIFTTAALNVIETFPVASMSAINNLQPQPANYFLDIYMRQVLPDKNKIHCYIDYYEHLLKVFPNLWDVYGPLGYCYHYLNDDVKAVEFLKIAVVHYPDCFWNYYNLAVIDMQQGRYAEASFLLKKALSMPVEPGLRRMFGSSFVYLPLFQPDPQKAFRYTLKHLEEMYRLSVVLEEILVRDKNEMRNVLPKFKLELYVF